MHIYVGNLTEAMTDEELRALFAAHGQVKGATVVCDKKTGASQRYGFVEMPVKGEARAAIEALRGKDMAGQPLRVKGLKPGDSFHDHALSLHGSKGVTPGGIPSRSEVSHRSANAIRRGGQRGS